MTHDAPLRLEIAERFLLLSHLIDELPEDDAGKICRAVSGACMAVVRNMRGRATDAEARFAIERAREAIMSANTRELTGGPT